jgi:hypothetical protein
VPSNCHTCRFLPRKPTLCNRRCLLCAVKTPYGQPGVKWQPRKEKK